MHRSKLFGGTLALVLFGATAFASFAAADDNTSTVTGEFTQAQVPRDNFKGGQLRVETTTTDTDDPGTPAAPTIFPTPTTSVNLDFDDDFKFTTRGLAKCTSSLLGTTTEQAIAACGASKVGTGSANVCLNNGVGGCTNLPAVVTAFNGPASAGGNPTIILHSRVGALAATTLITGELKNSPAALGDDYGKRLAVTVPLIGGGAGAITDFIATVKKRYTANGETRNYVAARCHDATRRWNFRSAFTYSDNGTDTVGDTQTCQVS